MLEYVYICRHGFRSNWVDPGIKTGPTGMNRDPPLAAYGQEQAVKLGAFLSDSKAVAPHPTPELVFSSPFYRCIESALPTYQALSAKGQGGKGMLLEHGVMEWYSTVNPNTGLHPRPADPPQLAPLFPPGSIDEEYRSTFYPSRRGETLKELQDRADTFIEAWTSRVEEMGVRSVVVFAHAASVIALGRALTGDKGLEVPAGCASASLYKRKVNEGNGQSDIGVGAWEPVWLGKADYLENGLERDWSYRDVVFVDGEVITDNGDRVPHPPEDVGPVGLGPGMDKYLRRGLPPRNHQIKEYDSALTAASKTPKM